MTNPALAFSALPIRPAGSDALDISDDRKQSILAAALEEVERAPLSSYPFAVKALLAERTGDQVFARTLMLRAMRLRPRNPAIRLWLAYSFAAGEQLEEAVQQAAMLYYLAPAMASNISPLLARVAQSSAGRRAIKTALGGTRHLMGVAQAAPVGSLGPPAVAELLGSVDETRLEAAQVRVVQEYLQANDYVGARRAWGRFLPLTEQSGTIVYDGSFAALPGAGQFNWQFTNSGDLQAGVAPSGLANPPGALRVERVGANAGTAARQNLVLEPGRYRLSHLLRFEEEASSSAPFAWRITCEKPSSQMIATLPLQGQAPQTWSRVGWDVAIPPDCRLALLELTSLPAEASIRSNALITDVSLKPLN